MKKYLLSSTYFWALFNEYHRRNVRLLLRHGSRVLQSSMMLHSLGCSQLWMFWEKQMVPLSMVKQSIMVFGLPEHWRKRLPPLYLDWLNMEGRDYRPCIWTDWTLKEETTAPVLGMLEHWRKRLPPLYLDCLNTEGRDYRPCISPTSTLSWRRRPACPFVRMEICHTRPQVLFTCCKWWHPETLKLQCAHNSRYQTSYLKTAILLYIRPCIIVIVEE